MNILNRMRPEMAHKLGFGKSVIMNGNLAVKQMDD